MAEQETTALVAGLATGALTAVLAGKTTNMLASTLQQQVDHGAPTEQTKSIIQAMLRNAKLDPTKTEIAVPIHSTENFYSPGSRTIVLSSADPAVALHEAGHAIQSQEHPAASRLADTIASLATPAALATAFLPRLSSSKNLQELEKYSPLVALIMGSPRLALEYDASRRALAYINKYRPDLYKETREKLNKALGVYALRLMETPAALSAGLAMEGLSKQAGASSLIGKGLLAGGTMAGHAIGYAIKNVPKWTLSSALTTGRITGDTIRAKGVGNKLKVLGRGMAGLDSPPKSTGEKVMLAGNVALAGITPYMAYKQIKKNPKDLEAWGENIGQMAGEALGGGKLLGTMYLGKKMHEAGAAVGRVANTAIHGKPKLESASADTLTANARV